MGEVVFLTYKCKLCGKFLPKADCFYDVKIEIISGKNQLLMGEEKPEELREQIDELLKKIAKTDPKELEEGIYLKREFHLCPECRAQLIHFLNL